MDEDNRRRTFSEIVSLDAWHEGFTALRKAVDLHVDVAFSTGRIGAEAGSNVRFRLRLKRAEVVVIVPPTEPAKIDKASVSRGSRSVQVKVTEVRKSKIAGQGSGAVGGNASSRGMSVKANARAGASLSKSRAKAVEISENGSALSVKQVATADGDYAWVVESSIEGALEGRPWDAVAEPRLKVIDSRADRSKGIAPSVRVEIRCLREDLEILDIALKDPNWAAIARDPLGRNRTLAAEAVIRTRLFESGLFNGDIADPFAKITLCATIAEGQ